MNRVFDIFSFKSNPDFFQKERDDVKNNTVRKIDLNDNRFIKLITYMQIGWNDGDIKIEICCDKVHPYKFTKDIRDICIWNDLMIITWNEKKIN
jgi:hypothetical protein